MERRLAEIGEPEFLGEALDITAVIQDVIPVLREAIAFGAIVLLVVDIRAERCEGEVSGDVLILAHDRLIQPAVRARRCIQ